MDEADRDQPEQGIAVRQSVTIREPASRLYDYWRELKNLPGIMRHLEEVDVTTTSICGSDLHLFDGKIPTMEKGDILGHEFTGEVVEVGPEVRNLAEGLFGFAPAGIYGYSHLTGGYAGGQAEYVRVPFADVGPLKIPDGLSDEQALFLSDVFPTGYEAIERCNLQGGEVVAVWGAGPVGQFTIRSAWMLGAERVIAIDRFPERLAMAASDGRTETLDYEETDILETLKELTGGRGPDICVDAVGMEAHEGGLVGAYDRVKQELKLETDRPHALRQAIMACRKGGTLSVSGVYGGFIDKIPMGAAFNKGLTWRMGQTHVHRYLRPLLARIEAGDIDPTFVITHRLELDDAPAGYRMFRDKEDECIKIVLTP